jgi:hypothetical protein
VSEPLPHEAPPASIAALFGDPAAVPLPYGYLRVAPTPNTVQRVGHSDWHRAAVYGCVGFPKPISRCLRPGA